MDIPGFVQLPSFHVPLTEESSLMRSLRRHWALSSNWSMTLEPNLQRSLFGEPSLSKSTS